MSYYDGNGNVLNIGVDIDELTIKSAVSDYLDDNPSMLTTFDARLIGKKIINGDYDKIICLGDSITNGDGGTDGYCYATVFKKYIEEKYNITVIKMGYPGSVASRQYERFMSLPDGGESQLVIWLTGTNNRVLNWQEYQDDMPAYVDNIKKRCTDILLMSCTPAPDDAGNTHKSTDVDDYLIKTFYGREYFIDMNRLYTDYFGQSGISASFADTVHPNDVGYLAIFTILCREIGLPLSYLTDFSQTGAWWQGT